MKVSVFQCPNGALDRNRSPFGHRPRKRVIFVVVPVSSMKISLCGASRILGWRLSFHCWRACRMSGRSCSLAISVFLKRYPARISQRESEAGSDRTPVTDSSAADNWVGHGDIILGGHPLQKKGAMRLQFRMTAPA